MWANGSPGSTSPAKVRNTGRTASSSRLSVTTMSRIGCAWSATASQTPRVSKSRRAAATIAEARSSSAWLLPSVGSATVTENDGPSPWRNAMRQRQPGKAAAGDQHIDSCAHPWRHDITDADACRRTALSCAAAGVSIWTGRSARSA